MQRMRRHGKEAWAGERMPLSGVGLTRKKLDDCENWTPGGVTVRGQGKRIKAATSGSGRTKPAAAAKQRQQEGVGLAGGVLEV